MSLIVKLCLLGLLASVVQAQMLKKEAYATVPQLIAAAGYPVAKYRVTTDDGYILQMHRIPAGRRAARRSDLGGKGKKPVLIIHGLLGSSGDFIIMGPGRSLAYMLADAGYDVWLGNLRGNYYSTHKNMSRSDPKFWDFSFHEHGTYDVPAMVDKVLEVTGLPKLLYVGYSMGTTSFFTMMAMRPEYNEKIVAFVALAPAVYLNNVKTLAEFGLKTMDFMNTLRSRGIHSMTVRSELMDVLIGGLCTVRQPQMNLCMSLVYSIVGEDYEQSDEELSAIILARFQPASLRQLEHFGKVAMTGVFTSWEDGLWGEVKPYNLSNVRVPVTLLYGANDQLTEKSQIMRLADALNTTGTLNDVRPACQWPKFNHLDFVFAKDVGKLLNKPLIAHINKLYEMHG